MRELTAKQHDALDRLDQQDPLARVVGWHHNGRSRPHTNEGPVIRRANGQRAYLGRGGRLRGFHADPRT